MYNASTYRIFHKILRYGLPVLNAAEILRVSGMLPSQGFGDFDRRQHRSPSPMASANIVSNIHGGGYGVWNGLHQEVFCLINFVQDIE